MSEGVQVYKQTALPQNKSRCAGHGPDPTRATVQQFSRHAALRQCRYGNHVARDGIGGHQHKLCHDEHGERRLDNRHVFAESNLGVQDDNRIQPEPLFNNLLPTPPSTISCMAIMAHSMVSGSTGASFVKMSWEGHVCKQTALR